MTNAVICRPAMPIVERSRKHEKSGWCFRCRARRDFDRVIRGFSEEDVRTFTQEIEDGHRPKDDIWALVSGGPFPSIECATCQETDADLGFGRVREWEE